MVTKLNQSSTPWRLSPASRKAVLVLHILSGIGWVGVDIAVFTLLLTARASTDATLVASAFNAIRIVVPVAVPPLSLGILVTGLLLGLGTPWGLLRYWWVVVKLGLSLVMTVLVFTSLVPGVGEIGTLALTTASADAVRASLGPLPDQLMYPPVVSFLMLSVATALSVFKPGRRTPWSDRSKPEVTKKR